MSFTLSFVIEVLIGGCFCSTWLILLVNWVMGKDLSTLVGFLAQGMDMGTLMLFVCLISVYVLGWISQYFCDLIFDNLLEKHIKGSPFKQKSDFHKARGLVMQEGSKTVIDDIQMDRQLLRLSKQICLNFVFIFAVGWLYVGQSWLFSVITAVLSAIVCVVSFFQWKKRYISVMYKFYRAEQSILLMKNQSEEERKSE